jgi:hypothetical protein
MLAMLLEPFTVSSLSAATAVGAPAGAGDWAIAESIFREDAKNSGVAASVTSATREAIEAFFTRKFVIIFNLGLRAF